MKIYTKLGDMGETSLIGGKRVSKDHPRIEAYGTIDELIAHIAVLKDSDISDEYKEFLLEIQYTLMECTAILASETQNTDYKLSVLTNEKIQQLEKEIDKIERAIPALKSFILPGGHITASFCHVARNVCRRAERIIIGLTQKYKTDNNIIKYLNRLSDYLFVLSRKIMKDKGVEEILWKKQF